VRAAFSRCHLPLVTGSECDGDEGGSESERSSEESNNSGCTLLGLISSSFSISRIFHNPVTPCDALYALAIRSTCLVPARVFSSTVSEALHTRQLSLLGPCMNFEFSLQAGQCVRLAAQ
jgi:hypothetical protein